MFKSTDVKKGRKNLGTFKTFWDYYLVKFSHIEFNKYDMEENERKVLNYALS